MSRKVVVTGMGVVSCFGVQLDSFWNSLIKGESGVDYITYFDTTHFDVKFAAEVKGFTATDYMEKKEARHMDTFTQYAVVAAEHAFIDSGLQRDKIDLERAGVITGSGIGGMETFEHQYRILFEKGPQKISPFFIPMMIPDITPGHISIKFGFKGPNYSTTSACASSSHAIGNAIRTIRSGEADLMITGGSEAAVTSMGVAGFMNMKALSTRNDDPKRASRPFDAERDGFVIGEGAGILVLESEEHALKRGARIYAELCGVGYSADAYHITAPIPDGNGAARAITAAINDAGVNTTDVDYINAHGTSTLHNDRIETKAIKNVFGDHAYRLFISSTKSMIGHLLGASGSLELIATILTINHGLIPPTINYTYPDPECDLNYVPNKTITKDVTVALSNSFGFGGHNVTLAVKKYLP